MRYLGVVLTLFAVFACTARMAGAQNAACGEEFTVHSYNVYDVIGIDGEIKVPAVGELVGVTKWHPPNEVKEAAYNYFGIGTTGSPPEAGLVYSRRPTDDYCDCSPDDKWDVHFHKLNGPYECHAVGIPQGGKVNMRVTVPQDGQLRLEVSGDGSFVKTWTGVANVVADGVDQHVHRVTSAIVDDCGDKSKNNKWDCVYIDIAGQGSTPFLEGVYGYEATKSACTTHIPYTPFYSDRVDIHVNNTCCAGCQ